MEKTSSVKGFQRGFTICRFLWVIALVVSPYWCFNSASALFESEFLTPNKPYIASLGNIDIFENSLSDKQKAVDFNVTVFDLVGSRNTLSFNHFIPNMEIFAEILFLPSFIEYREFGEMVTLTPTAMVAGLNYQIINLKLSSKSALSLSAKGIFGYESIGDYDTALLYHISIGGTYTLNSIVSFGVLGVFPQFESVRASAGFCLEFSSLLILGAYDWENPYHTLKLGTIVKITPTFHLNLGGNYTLFYDGWKASLGMRFILDKVMPIPFTVDTAVSYNYYTGITLMVALQFGIPEKKSE